MEMVNCRSDFGASFPNWLVSSRGLRHELDNVVLDACLMEKVESLAFGDYVGFPACDRCCELVIVISMYAERNCPMSSFPVLCMEIVLFYVRLFIFEDLLMQLEIYYINRLCRKSRMRIMWSIVLQ